MGQGPKGQLLVIGRGRLARHFCHYLTLLGQPHRQWHRGLESPPEEAAQHCSRVLLAISDDAIADFLQQHPLPGKLCIHCSGSRSFKEAFGCHPLMTFAQELYSLQQYQTIPFILEEGAPSFQELLPELPTHQPHFRLAVQDKALYHALCVLAGNFTGLLWNRLFEGFAQLGLPPQAALPYLGAVQEQIGRFVAPDGQMLAHWSGPLSRGDRATLERNLRALEGDPYHQVYASLVKAFQASRAVQPRAAVNTVSVSSSSLGGVA